MSPSGAAPGFADVGYDEAMRRARALVPVLRELPELWYQWDQPFVLDCSRFQGAFGPFAVTPMEEALGETVAWFRRHA